jgi:hypothetical protein
MFQKYSIVILLSFAFQSCEFSDPKITKITQDYFLLESSMEFIPYANVREFIYKDSSGTEAIFDVSDPIQSWIMIFDPICYEDSIKGDTTKYFLKQHYLQYILTSDSLQIEFIIQLMPIPHRGYVKEGFVKDELRIGISTDPVDFFRGVPPKESFAANSIDRFGYTNTHELVFTHIIDVRNYPYAKQESPFDKFILNGKEYTNVFDQNKKFSGYPYLEIKVQKVIGILAFNDKDGNTWVFDRVALE